MTPEERIKQLELQVDRLIKALSDLDKHLVVVTRENERLKSWAGIPGSYYFKGVERIKNG